MPQLLAIGLPQVSITNQRDWSENELVDGQMKTLLLLAEHRLDNFDLILNKFHHFLSDKLLKKLVPRVAQIPTGPEPLQILMKSHAVKGFFFERVTKSGLLSIADSFEAFFAHLLAGAARLSKTGSQALFNCLKEEPYSLAFALYLLKTSQVDLSR